MHDGISEGSFTRVGRFNGILDPLGGHVISPYNVDYVDYPGIQCPLQFSRKLDDNIPVDLTRLSKDKDSILSASQHQAEEPPWPLPTYATLPWLCIFSLNGNVPRPSPLLSHLHLSFLLLILFHQFNMVFA